MKNPQPASTRWKTPLLLLVGLMLPIIAFSLVQHARYGFALFLGWDTSTYVWWASIIYEKGLILTLSQNYPNLYVLILAAFGSLMQSASLGERILPLLAASPLAYAYYSLTFDLTSNRKLGYLSVLLGGLTVNTLRLYSDLHRNLLSYSVSMTVGALISSYLSSKPLASEFPKKQALLLWLPLLAVAAYTQIETYWVLALAVFLLFCLQRRLKTSILAALLLSTPILLALPLIWPFLLNYTAASSLLGIPPSPAIVIAADALLFLGGFALPWVAVGLVSTIRKARLGIHSARFLVLWLLAILLLSPLAVGLGVPISRLFFIVPVPVLVASGIPSALRFSSTLTRGISWGQGAFLQFRLRPFKKPLAASTVIALIVATTFLTSLTTADLFLRPYVSLTDVDRLVQAAEIARQSGYLQPILVMYGATAADLNPIYRAYFGIEIPSNFAYYGKLQYIFSLPEPTEVYNWQYNPSFERASSLRYRSEILAQLGTPSSLTSHAIVIAGGRTYDRPLSEVFISQFETAPGIYIIPPGQLTPEQIDSWRLYAYSDWTSSTATTTANATWARSPTILNWVDKNPKSPFQANFSISLARPWDCMEMAVRFYDWPQPLIFPDTSIVALAPLEISLDGVLVQRHSYNDQGPWTILNSLANVTSGVHQISIRSGSPGLGVAVALDEIQLYPIPCQP